MAARDPWSDEAEEHRAPAGFGRRRRAALAAATVVAALAAGSWLERRPIASRLIDDRLASSHVVARYRIADLGPGRQRLTDVVIGDPADPDLVADWIETRTSLGLGGATLTGVRAGQVRLRARWRNGHLSLGSLDRLLPAGGAGRTGLPALSLDLADVRVRLETPAGVIGARIGGRGRLDRSFAGRLALVAGGLAGSGCRTGEAHALVRLTTGADGVRLAGPWATRRPGCGASAAAQAAGTIDATLAADLSHWGGSGAVTAASLVDPRGRARSVAGELRFAGDAGATTGTLSLVADAIAAPRVAIARGTLAGRFAISGGGGGGGARFDGDLVVSGASLDAATIRALRRGGSGAAGSPVAPLATAASAALVRAAGRFGGTARLSLATDDRGTHATLTRAAIGAASGATARFDGTLPLDDPRHGGGALALAGGGLPTVNLAVGPGSGGTVEGTVIATPYQAGGARLALAPTAFAWVPGRSFHAATIATLSGPFAGGAVAGLTLPLAVRRDPGGALLVGERCAPVAFERLSLVTLTLAPTRLTLCPFDGALVRVDPHGLGGGVAVGPVRLVGRLGDTPLVLAATGVRAGIAGRDVTVSGLAAALGSAGRETRFTATTLDARPADGGIGGTVAGLGGQIGAVPLALADGTASWRFAGGALTLSGGLTVLDAEAADPRRCVSTGPTAPPRFCPMLARDVALRLHDGRIDVTGTLAEPVTRRTVATVTIAHDLAAGAGHADLAIDSLRFDPTLQPDRLTPLVLGVVADVAGTVDGHGHIAWSDAGVTSTGRFATASLDLAAAFGPVTGIAGSIDFTDLLALQSAPGQVLTVRSINPGIAVENGTVRFHLDPGTRIAVEDARWPFAGGRLSLDPTLLDFSAPAERRMTFRVDGVAADQFLQQFQFKNLSATGTFDGVLPMVFDASGGRIEQGHLIVREGGGGLAYVGEVSTKDLGFWGNLAFGALKSLRYRSLAIAMNGPLAGEMVTEVRFAGISQGAGAKSNFLIRRLQRLPFVFNVTIKAPFRELIQTTGSLSDPTDLLRRTVPGLFGGAAGVQPGDSAPVPDTKRP